MLRRFLPYLCLLLPALAAGAEEDSAQALFDAARSGDLDAVRTLVKSGIDVNSRTDYDATALTYACDKGHLDVVRFLVEAGADINSRDSFYNSTPIIWAAMRGHAEIVGLLTAKGAVDASNTLIGAIIGDEMEVLRSVLENRELDAENLTSLLQTAIQQDKEEAAKILRAAGAELPPEPSFEAPMELLASYAGTYRTAEGTTLVLELGSGFLSAVSQDGSQFELQALDETTFQAKDFPGIKVVLTKEEDRTTGLELRQVGRTVIFQRIVSDAGDAAESSDTPEP